MGTGEGHGGSGTEMCNFYTSDGTDIYLYQELTLIVGRKYRFSINIDTATDDGILIFDARHGMWVAALYTTTGIKTFTFVASHTNPQLRIGKRAAVLTDITFDDVSIKPCAAEVFDYSLNGHGGALIDTDSPITLKPTYPGFDFDGSNDYIDIGTGPTSTKTISLWVKQSDISGNEYPIDLNGTDYIAVESGVVTVYGLAGHSLYVDSVAGTSGVTTITTGWHHIALTDSTANNASDLDIGRVTAAYFDGIISEVRLYNRVLNAVEVKNIYELSRWRYGV